MAEKERVLTLMRSRDWLDEMFADRVANHHASFNGGIYYESGEIPTIIHSSLGKLLDDFLTCEDPRGGNHIFVLYDNNADDRGGVNLEYRRRVHQLCVQGWFTDTPINIHAQLKSFLLRHPEVDSIDYKWSCYAPDNPGIVEHLKRQGWTIRGHYGDDDIVSGVLYQSVFTRMKEAKLLQLATVRGTVGLPLHLATKIGRDYLLHKGDPGKGGTKRRKRKRKHTRR